VVPARDVCDDGRHGSGRLGSHGVANLVYQ
jgi:hypothetical protein